MRERNRAASPAEADPDKRTQQEAGTSPAEVPCDERAFFRSFYRATLRGEVKDRMTIGSITDPEARFHYNAVENAIIRSMLRREPAPDEKMAETWRLFQQRRNLRLLDIGSGTGHSIDFFLEIFLVNEAVGIEISTEMAAFLHDKYQDTPGVTILEADIAGEPLTAEDVGAPFDFISAIGVMFHIVEEAHWKRGIANLAAVLKPGGLMLVGGDFGAETKTFSSKRSIPFRHGQSITKRRKAMRNESTSESVR